MVYEIENYYGECKISVTGKIWTISSWHVKETHRHKGIGKSLLSDSVNSLLRAYGNPDEVRYIWNGQNKYVYSWLERFNAKCLAGINIQKNNTDDWESHVYVLDKEKFLLYCKKD